MGFFSFISIDLNDREPSKKGFLTNFSHFVLAAAHTSRVSCGEMAGDRPIQPAYKIFSIKD